jgi:hypothetical protein
MTGELSAGRLDLGPIDDEFEDLHVLMYHTGVVYNKTNTAEVRERAAV